MGVVEIVRLRPAPGVTEAVFLAATDGFERAYMKDRDGFKKRTLLRSDEGEWTVLVDWETAEAAQSSMDAFPNDPASAPFNAVLDPTLFEMTRFTVVREFKA
ncbi:MULTISPECIES: hypothetical protein [unclassified Sphingopyxis]|uniref:antibiotic biosynthesis monooxygenase family protein n=1 Tax=unclassified Sphingopyxis TaxID=2614943 RepID=UPI002860E334|nr:MULTISPECIES: hypothetical protein [unclassified Sphingopyxis]MDR6832591.1 hypothetical protein [Sphingopyxis sp. BE122]MDR7228334.1 hypothetical protein [Sphingopyxis sp. BE259]